MICPRCNTPNPDGATFCGNCGATFTAGANPTGGSQNASANSNFAGYCPNCGTPIQAGAFSCSKCGMRFASGGAANGMNGGQPVYHAKRSRLVAAVLALLFGMFALEDFYLGDTSNGIAHVVVSVLTCGFGGMIWGFVNAIKLLTHEKNTDAFGNELKDFDF